MHADFARQREQFERGFEIDVVPASSLSARSRASACPDRPGSAFRSTGRSGRSSAATGPFGPSPSGMPSDGNGGSARLRRAGERAREFARRIAVIVRAADERAELAEAQRKLADAAERAGARIASRLRVGGKMCGPSTSFSVSSTCVMRRSPMSAMAPLKSFQKSRISFFHGRSPAETWSSFSSRSAVKSYSTYLREEILQERGDEAAAVIRDEAVLVHRARNCVRAASRGSRRRWKGGRCRVLRASSPGSLPNSAAAVR